MNDRRHHPVAAGSHRSHPSTSRPPPDPARCAPLADALLHQVRTLGAQFVEQRAHPCHALAWRLWHFHGALLTCGCRPDVPADNNDNNAAERAIRDLVVARKISGGSRAPRGSQTRMALGALAATWSASGLRPRHAFRRLLQSPLPQM